MDMLSIAAICFHLLSIAHNTYIPQPKTKDMIKINQLSQREVWGELAGAWEGLGRATKAMEPVALKGEGQGV